MDDYKIVTTPAFPEGISLEEYWKIFLSYKVGEVYTIED